MTTAKSRQHVVFAIPDSSGIGGAQRVFLDLVNNLNPRRFAVHVVSRAVPGGDGLNTGIDVHLLDSIRPLPARRTFAHHLRFRLVLALHFARAVGECPPDAPIISFMEAFAEYAWMLRAATGRPYVASLHTNESHYIRLTVPRPVYRAIERRLLPIACRGASRIVVPSQGCRADLAESFDIPLGLIQVVPNPIDCTRIRRQLSLPLELPVPNLKGRTLFVHVGQLVEYKNHDLLLSASKILRERWNAFVVVCLGDGPLRRRIQAQIVEAGLTEHVYLLGSTDNPFPFMARARALLLTSHYEGFALVLVEAMAAGTVIVTVDCPSGPKEIVGDNEWGVLVPPNDPEALANAMWQIAHDDDLFWAFRRAGEARSLQYDVPGVARLWENLLEEVIQSS